MFSECCFCHNAQWLLTLPDSWLCHVYPLHLGSPRPILPSPQHSFYHLASQAMSPTLDRHSATSLSQSPFPNPYLLLPLLPNGKATIQEGQVWHYTSPRQPSLLAPRLSSWTFYCTEQPRFHTWLVDPLVRNEDHHIVLYPLPSPAPGYLVLCWAQSRHLRSWADWFTGPQCHLVLLTSALCSRGPALMMSHPVNPTASWPTQLCLFCASGNAKKPKSSCTEGSYGITRNMKPRHLKRKLT